MAQLKVKTSRDFYKKKTFY